MTDPKPVAPSPCPFCGGTDLILHMQDGERIVCQTCEAQGPMTLCEVKGENAWTVWERRVAGVGKP